MVKEGVQGSGAGFDRKKSDLDSENRYPGERVTGRGFSVEPPWETLPKPSVSVP